MTGTTSTVACFSLLHFILADITLLLFSMKMKRHSASQSANIIMNWLGEESEDDDSYCGLAESSDDEVDNILIEDAAKSDNSSSSGAEQKDVLINSEVSTASAEYLGKLGRCWSDILLPTSRTRGSNIFTVSNWGV